ncbi:DUF5682 family protein [Rhodococcus erythropolis]|uniref:DUF5682 family protein n=1 Tax=Rhodococcus erythropolis TaxID=1833 RepID=UPI003671A305
MIFDAVDVRRDIEEQVSAVVASTTPYLIGVRHHSPVLAAAVPALLDGFDPQVVVVELPADFQSWISHLADPGLVTPVALAGVHDDTIGFYPFADFSPELAAIRWAAKRNIPVIAGDLPLVASARNGSPASESADPHRQIEAPTGRVGDDAWDRLVEVGAPDSSSEQIRTAALTYGWAIRAATPRIAAADLAREKYMRHCISGRSESRVAAVIGAFHASALIHTSYECTSEQGRIAAPVTLGEVTTSLVPYTFALLDDRSGYPAGIRDPQFQQAVWQCANDVGALERSIAAMIVAVCREIRRGGEPAGPAEAREALRVAGDLARLRNLPAPGRGEVVEALQTVLASGDVLGRGRLVAAAMSRVLIGDRRGALAPGIPVSGLMPAVDDELRSLRLPNSESPERKELRLDPMRSDLDRRRTVALARLAILGIHYGDCIDGGAGIGATDTLTARAEMQWTPATEAGLHAASAAGVTLVSAATGRLRVSRDRQIDAGGPTLAEASTGLMQAAECGITSLIEARVGDLERAPVVQLADVVHALSSLAQVRAGLGAADRAGDLSSRAKQVSRQLRAAGLRALSGYANSVDEDDVSAVVGICRAVDRDADSRRLRVILEHFRNHGSPMMSAVAVGIQLLVEHIDDETGAQLVGSWFDTALDAYGRSALRERLRGLLTTFGPFLDTILESLCERVDSYSDDNFVARLPALRGGFDALSPADRSRLLHTIRRRYPHEVDRTRALDPATAERAARADLAGADAARAAGLTEPSALFAATGRQAEQSREKALNSPSENAFSPLDRWRLILGTGRSALSRGAMPYADALDQMYGRGRGEGSGLAIGTDDAPPTPNVREWSMELAVMFDADVYGEVLSEIVIRGNPDAAQLLESATVRPSVELLTAMLTLAGGLPEFRLARLRPVVATVVAELTRALEVRLRPALSGINVRRTTTRRTNRLDLRATTRANLHTAHDRGDGVLVLAPERALFQSRAARSVDWHLVVLTDVSGSMEASTVWAALTTAILAGVPALDVRYLTFSTEVADLTKHVDDPLSLLLEIQVGGGTNIAKALRVARESITVPSRTLVVVVSDFEEGAPLGVLFGEVRALIDSGVRLLGCASLDEKGSARFSADVGGGLAAAGMPVAALSPLRLAEWIASTIS